MKKDETKDVETQTVENSATVFDALNVSHSLDTINAGHVPLDSRGVSTSSFSVEETLNNSGEAPSNFERAACNLNKTDSTSENGQHQPKEQQPVNNGATTGSHSTSKTEGSIGTIDTGKASF
jgi:hypothetical protein